MNSENKRREIDRLQHEVTHLHKRINAVKPTVEASREKRAEAPEPSRAPEEK
jgi:uncharacterized coiled-coil protein SlyX